MLYDAHFSPSGEDGGRESACGNPAFAFASEGRKFFSHRTCLSFSCIQRFGTPDTWSTPDADILNRQVSTDGPESLRISLPFGSILPFSERSHHEPNLCSVPVPVVWTDESSLIFPSLVYPGPGGCMKDDSDLAFAFLRRVLQGGCKPSKGLVGK